VIDGSRPVLLKVDKTYPFGETEDAFKAFARRLGELSEPASKGLLVAEVHVQNYGERDNDDVRERLGVVEAELPAFFLYQSGQVPAADGPGPAARFEGEVTADSLAAFVRRQLGVRLAGPGTLPAMESLAEAFLGAETSESRGAVLARAEAAAGGFAGDDGERALVYVRLMQKAAAKGLAWAASELKRLRGMADAPMSEERRGAMRAKLEVLPSLVRDEL